MNDFFITTQEAADIIGVTRAHMSWLRKKSKGPAYELSPPLGGYYHRTRFTYRLDAVLTFLASRGMYKSEVEAVRIKTINARRQKLARKADAARNTAMSAIRRAHAARVEAAEAGHRPSVKMIAANQVLGDGI